MHALLDEWRAAATAGDDPLVTLAGALHATFGLPPRTREEILRRAARILGTEGRLTSGVVGRLGVGNGWNLRRGGFKAQPLRRSLARRIPWASSISTSWQAAIGLAAAAAMLMIGWHFSVGAHVHSPLPPTIYATHNGQRADISLPDGSTVLLNVASWLEVPTDFAMGNRTVRLHGEALFSVTHRGETPFTVIAGPTTSRVLGTSFVVRRYPTDTVTMVAVRDGRVGVENVVLTAHQAVNIATTGVVLAHEASPSQFTFASGILTLDGITLKDAIPELDRWYDADIRLADPSLGSHTIQIAAAAGSLADVANMLAFTFNAQIVRDGRVITLYPKR